MDEDILNPGTGIIERSAVEAIERAQIDTQIATAKKYPLHTPGMLSQVKAAMLSFATLDEETAAGCFYTLPRGGKAIQGPSVRMAEIAISCYGNIRDSVRVIDVVSSGDTPHVVVQAVAHDLERNVAISIEKRRRITKKKFKESIDEDDINLAVNGCTAIAFRDAAFKVIPLALIKPVVEAAKRVAVGDIKSLVAKRTQVVERLKLMGVPESRILAVVGCLKVEDIAVEHLEILIGLGTALKDGETSIEEAFPIVTDQKPGVEGLKERLKKDKKKPVKETATEKAIDEHEKAARDAADLAEVDSFSKPAAENQQEGVQDEPQTTKAEEVRNGVDSSERFFCPKCDGVFADAKGKNKDVCPNVNCLSKGVVDRWSKQ